MSEERQVVRIRTEGDEQVDEYGVRSRDRRNAIDVATQIVNHLVNRTIDLLPQRISRPLTKREADKIRWEIKKVMSGDDPGRTETGPLTEENCELIWVVWKLQGILREAAKK